MTTAGLIFDSSVHYLDHLAPLCSLMNWPLILCDASIAQQARQFYPNIQIIERDIVSLSFWLASHFSQLISCYPRALLEASLGKISSVQWIWLPHGHSDKERQSSCFQLLKREDLLLIYGERMQARLIQSGVSKDRLIEVGNFRKMHFFLHRDFYADLLAKSFGAVHHPIILYSPTWDDSHQNNSFWKVFIPLASDLSDDFTLWVKPHPNTLLQFQPQLERWAGKYESSRLRFIFTFPPIYPLLDHADIYLGDMSSIGYDFLSFDRPLFFCPSPKFFPLHQCGTRLSLNHLSEFFIRCNEAKKIHQKSFSSLCLQIARETFSSFSPQKVQSQLLEKSHARSSFPSQF